MRRAVGDPVMPVWPSGRRQPLGCGPLIMLLVAGSSVCSAEDPGNPLDLSGWSARATTLSGVGPPAAEPKTPGQRGFVVPTYARERYDSTELVDYFTQITDTGAEWLQLNPTWYQDTTVSGVIAEGEIAPTDANIENAIGLAHQAGLKVTLKTAGRPSGRHPRGEIRPADRAAWFASYETFIGRFADLATRTGAEQFAVGTELTGLSDDREGWLRVVQTVRSRLR